MKLIKNISSLFWFSHGWWFINDTLSESVNFRDMTLAQHWEFIKFDKNADGSSIIFNYSKLPKMKLIKELEKIKDSILIPNIM